ncbi:MAG: 4-hydroxy-tetrahydrodipicolinate reductase [Rhodothermales bacterium]
MKLALIGTGQMGRAVAVLAKAEEHEIVAEFNTQTPFSEAADPGALNGADIAIDTSLPSVVLGHIRRCCEWGVPLVVATTGWYDHLADVQAWVRTSEKGAVLYAPNFSLGVAMLSHALRAVAPLLDVLPDFDPYVHEVHHVRKQDSPSGTALLLGGILQENLSRKTHLATEAQHEPIDPAALHVTSTRAGRVFGEHTIGIDGPFEQITLTHTAKSRDGFAYGALRAAAWLPGHVGLFTLDDMLDSVLHIENA